MILILPGIVILIGGIALMSAANTATVITGIATAVIGFLIIMLGALIISAMRGIYSMALYYYAKGGQVLGGFSGEELQASVRLKP